jgi:hypothetical protein
MTGGLRFEVELPFGTLAVQREFAGGYRLECTALPSRRLTVGDALRFGRAGETIERRFAFAGRRGGDVKTGPVVARKEGTGELIIELNAVDNDTIVVRLFGSSKMTLHGEEAGRLLELLCRVADDARACGGGGGGVASRLASVKGGNHVAGLHEAIERRLGWQWLRD